MGDKIEVDHLETDTGLDLLVQDRAYIFWKPQEQKWKEAEKTNGEVPMVLEAASVANRLRSKYGSKRINYNENKYKMSAKKLYRQLHFD